MPKNDGVRENMGVQYDERGRPFSYIGNTNRRSYISPVAMGTGTRPTDGGGPFRTDYGWDTDKGEWTRGVDWGNVMSAGIGGALAAPFLAPAIGSLGGGSSAASIPTSVGIPGGALPGVGMAAPAAAAAGGSTVAGAGSGLSFGKLLALGGVGTGFDLLGSLLGGGGGDEPKQSFAGKRGSNGVSVDPTEVYSQGLAGLQDLMPIVQNRVKSPVQLRSSFVQPLGTWAKDPATVEPRAMSLRNPSGPNDTGGQEEFINILKMLGLA